MLWYISHYRVILVHLKSYLYHNIRALMYTIKVLRVNMLIMPICLQVCKYRSVMYCYKLGYYLKLFIMWQLIANGLVNYLVFQFIMLTQCVTQCVIHNLYTDNNHLLHQFTLAPCFALIYQFIPLSTYCIQNE